MYKTRQEFYQALQSCFLNKADKPKEMREFCLNMEVKYSSRRINNSDENCLLGCSLFVLGKYERAIYILKMVMEDSKSLDYLSLSLAILCLGKALLETREYEGALVYFSHLLQYPPEYKIIAYEYCGEASLALRAYKEAEEYFTKLVNAKPDDEGAKSHLAVATKLKITMPQQSISTPISSSITTFSPNAFSQSSTVVVNKTTVLRLSN
ncbi:MAG: hypothetical protein WCW01_00745 [Gammaproteobacteria bacterium]